MKRLIWKLIFSTQKIIPIAETLPAIKDITVKSYTVLEEASLTDVYDTYFEITEQTLIKITYDAVASPSGSITNGTIDSATYYTTYAELLVTPTGGTMNIKVSGYKLNISSNVIVKNYNEAGEDVNIDNIMITEDDDALSVGEFVGNWYSNRIRYNTRYRGRPEIDTSDIVSMQSRFTSVFTARILNHTLDYNGAWSGTLLLTRTILNREVLHSGALVAGTTSTLQGGW